MIPREIEDRLDMIRQCIEGVGAELVDLTVRKSGKTSFFAFIVDKVGGISLDDCADINHRLSALFDSFEREAPAEGSLVLGPYVLEVSSPGLDRPLRTQKDFNRAFGQKISCIIRSEMGTKEVAGKVLGVEGPLLKLELRGGLTQSVPLDTIVKAKREIIF